MITYASFLPKKSDLTNNAFIVSLADAGVSFFAAFAVFSIIGYLSFSQGANVVDLENIAGPHLAFVTYPTGISLLPFAAVLFGLIFYLALLIVGIDSAFSMIEPISTAAHNKWKISKEKVTGLLCIIGFFLSLIFVTGNGFHLIDIIDHFVTNFGLVLIGLIECIIFGWMFAIPKLREHAN